MGVPSIINDFGILHILRTVQYNTVADPETSESGAKSET